MEETTMDAQDASYRQDNSEAACFYAHRSEDGRLHKLADHLRNTAYLAALFGQVWGKADEAKVVGLLHDLGKYRREFQEYLLGERSSGPDTHHSVYGAALAHEKEWYACAFAVAGHHSGLHDGAEGIRNFVFDKKYDRDCLRHLEELFAKEVGKLPDTVPAPPCDTLSYEFYIRMLFSCLVDADWLDTEEAVSGRKHLPVRLPDVVDDLIGKLTAARNAKPHDGLVNQIRHSVFEQCVRKAEMPQGFFSLTVPTGGGKTLSGMAFALTHARRWNLNRVIVVVPYLSIIEQNAAEYQRIFDSENRGIVVEHHSAVSVRDRGDEKPTPAELAAENWDAPVIVTTSVQFIETLFANTPSKCRKLHNIAKSVVVMDEVQTLPIRLLRPLLSVFRELKENYGTSFLFMTATQPAFEKPSDAPEHDFRWSKGTVMEVIDKPQQLFDRLKRVAVTWPYKDGLSTKSTWDEITSLMRKEPRVLCVVNTKSHAMQLYKRLCKHGDEGLWHLSTRMCPRHRLDAISQIRSALAHNGKPCRVVSTQLVEAGVDLDFPVVLRAMGPLDSIAQAAGRCDREGRLTAAQGYPSGRVIVFEPDVPSNQATPPGSYRDATTVTRTMAEGGDLSIHETAHVRGYFNRYYQRDLDPDDINPLRRRLQFREVAARAVVIDSALTPVFVPYDGNAKTLLRELEKRRQVGIDLLRRLQRYQIGLYERELDKAVKSGAVYELVSGYGLWCCDSRFYKNDVGFVMESDDPLIA